MVLSVRWGGRATLLLVFALLPSLGYAQASAPEEAEKLACINAHAEGQELRNAKKLAKAKERLIECSTRACPTPILRECSSLLTEVMTELPTLALSVNRPGGEALMDAKISVDGLPWDGPLGIAREIDPGVHEVRVSHPLHGEATRVITVLEGKKAQSAVLEIGLPSDSTPKTPPPPPPADPGRSLLPPTGAFVFFGLSVAAFATGTALGIVSLDLEDTVATQADLDELETLRLGADISFIGGGAFAAVGVIWWIVDATSDPGLIDESARSAVKLDVQPLNGGVWFGLRVAQ